jgi:hypothetical protein
MKSMPAVGTSVRWKYQGGWRSGVVTGHRGGYYVLVEDAEGKEHEVPNWAVEPSP